MTGAAVQWLRDGLGIIDAASEFWRLDLAFEPAATRSTVDAAYADWKRAVERSRNWATG